MCYFSGVVDIVPFVGVCTAFSGVTFSDLSQTGEQKYVFDLVLTT